MRQQQYEDALKRIRAALNKGFAELNDTPTLEEVLDSGGGLSAAVKNMEEASLKATDVLDEITNIVSEVLGK